jgi:hypothetical protein
MPLFRDIAYNKACPHLPDWFINHNLNVSNQTFISPRDPCISPLFVNLTLKR